MSEEPPFVERRAHPRTKVQFPLRVAHYFDEMALDQLRFVTRQSRDLSVGGISFFTDAPPLSAQLVVALRLGNSVRHMLIHVRNVVRVADSNYFVCCQFIKQLE